jgi:hypothetical protein
VICSLPLGLGPSQDFAVGVIPCLVIVLLVDFVTDLGSYRERLLIGALSIFVAGIGCGVGWLKEWDEQQEKTKTPTRGG